jgi:hypothetical protein
MKRAIVGVIEASACTIIGATVGDFLWSPGRYHDGAWQLENLESHATFVVGGAVLAVICYWLAVAMQGGSETTNT